MTGNRAGGLRPRALVAWLMFATGAALVLWMGSPDWSAPTTSRFIRPILEFLFPDLTPHQIVNAHFYVRKGVHVLEYAVLGLLAFRALRLSLDTLLARIALGAILMTLTVAALDETRQAFSHARTGSARDVALDATGALIAVGLTLIVVRRRDRRAADDGALSP